MNSILYAIIKPWGILLAFSIGYVICVVRKRQKASRKKREKFFKYFRLKICFCVCAALLCAAKMSYMSLDLIKQDYCEITAVYEEPVSIRGVGRDAMHFTTENGLLTVYYYWRDFRGYEFVEGKTYHITYARRSRVLLECR